MITPDFTISQDEAHIILNIKLPYVKIKASEVYVEPNSFTFYLKPYYLKLNFAQTLQSGESAIASSIYDHNTYIVKFEVKKSVAGETFQDLDIMSKLFEKRPATHKGKPNIEVLASTQSLEGSLDSPSEPSEGKELVTSQYKYGFDRACEDMFVNHQEELYEMGDLDPALTPVDSRIPALFFVEGKHFDPDHYVCDFFDDRPIKDVMKRELLISVRDKLVAPDKVEYESIK